MPIDFSTYAPTTVLRVRCRDGVEGVVHIGPHREEWPHLLVRDDFDAVVIKHDGRRYASGEDHDYDVTAIIGEMVLVQGN